MTVEINNPYIEDIVKSEVKKNDTTISEYISGLVLKEIESLKVKKELKSVEREFRLYQDGKLELNSVDELVKECEAMF